MFSIFKQINDDWLFKIPNKAEVILVSILIGNFLAPIRSFTPVEERGGGTFALYATSASYLGIIFPRVGGNFWSALV